MSTLEERVAALEEATERLETIVDQGTEAGKYTKAVEEYAEKYGLPLDEAVKNFNAMLEAEAKKNEA